PTKRKILAALLTAHPFNLPARYLREPVSEIYRQLSTSVDLSGSPLQHRVCDLPLSRQCIYTNPSSSPARESQLSRTFLIIFLIAGSTRVFAQTLIDGTVRAGAGNPLSGASVRLLRQDGGPMQTASTASDGRFHFPSVEAGPYTLKVDAAGFYPAEHTFVLRPR